MGTCGSATKSLEGVSGERHLRSMGGIISLATFPDAPSSSTRGEAIRFYIRPLF